MNKYNPWKNSKILLQENYFVVNFTLAFWNFNYDVILILKFLENKKYL